MIVYADKGRVKEVGHIVKAIKLNALFPVVTVVFFIVYVDNKLGWCPIEGYLLIDIRIFRVKA